MYLGYEKNTQWINIWLRAYPTFYMCNCKWAMQGSPTGMKIEFSRSLPTLLEGQESLDDGVYDKHSGSQGLSSSLTVKKEKVLVGKKKKRRRNGVECIMSSMLMINKSLRSPAPEALWSGWSFIFRFHIESPEAAFLEWRVLLVEILWLGWSFNFRFHNDTPETAFLEWRGSSCCRRGWQRACPGFQIPD